MGPEIMRGWDKADTEESSSVKAISKFFIATVLASQVKVEMKVVKKKKPRSDTQDRAFLF